MRRPSADQLLVLLLAPVLVGLAAAALGPPATGEGGTMGRFQAAVGLASAGWLGAVALAWRAPTSRRVLPAVVAGAIALRLLALAGDPGLSDDRYRYAFEGGLVLRGESPYAAAPASPERAEARRLWPAVAARVEHPHVPAAYPPLAQGSFALAVLASGGVERAPRGLRVLYALCDLAVLVPLLAWLRARGRPPGLAVAWAWSPLAALSFAGSGHFDALGILLLVLGLAAAAGGRAVRGAAALAAGAGVKLLPILALPFALQNARRRRAAWAAALVLLALALGPLLLLPGGTRGLSEYAFRWEAASFLHRFVEPALEDAFGLERDEGRSDPRRVARALAAAAVLAAAAGLWRARARPEVAAGALVALVLVLAPALHPWYVAWAVPFLALVPSLGIAALAAAAPLLWGPRERWVEEGVWAEPAWLWPAVLLPVLLLFLVDGVRAWRARRAA